MVVLDLAWGPCPKLAGVSRARENVPREADVLSVFSLVKSLIRSM